jgi:hypothetical protein
MTINFLNLFILFFLAGCSVFINKIDDDLLNEQTISIKKKIERKTYCAESEKIELVGDSARNQKVFLKFINNFQSNKKFTFADKVALWALVQMNLRPELSSPTAKLQFLIHRNDRTHFIHLYHKEGSQENFPYLHGVDAILEQFHGNYKLAELATIYDMHYPQDLFVSANFANFLNKNLEKITMTPSLKNTYIRGDETLKENERIKKQNISVIIKKYLQAKKTTTYTINSNLFSNRRNKQIMTECNYDMALYQNSIFLIHEKRIDSHTFGLSDEHGSFMADSTQSLKELNSLGNTLYFTGTSHVKAPAICLLKSAESNKWESWLFSSLSRDPGQHIFHLLENSPQEKFSIRELDQQLKSARHLFLKNPVRLVLESERSTPAQLNALLKLNIPIYNATQLGRVWGHVIDGKNKNFVIDERVSGELSCQL